MIKTSEFIEQYKKGKVPASTLVKMAAFRDELEKLVAEQGITKIAAAMPDWYALKMGFGQALAGATSKIPEAVAASLLVGGGMVLFMEAVKALEGKVVDWYNDFQKPKLFSQMLELHPALKEYDVELVKKYYEALWHFSPVMAENPLAAGAYIRQALTMHHVAGGPLPSSIGEISMIQKSWKQGTEDTGTSLMTTMMNPFSQAAGFSKKEK